MLSARKAKTATILGDVPDPGLVAQMAHGLELRSYRFDKYKTREKAEDKPQLTEVAFACAFVLVLLGKFVVDWVVSSATCPKAALSGKSCI